MKKKNYFSALIFSVLLFFSCAINTFAAGTVASLGKVKGDVSIKLNVNGRIISGNDGFLLKDGDLVITGKGTNVSVIFRDGSEVRIFENTKFLIEQAVEEKGSGRNFKYDFFMKVGSFWGKFIKGRQKTTIKTPTATIGIKGTSLKVKAEKDKSGLVLSEGKVSVKNEDSSAVIDAGKMIDTIMETGKIKTRDIPYKIFISTADTKLKFPKIGSSTHHLSLQLINQKTKQNLKRPGNVLISSPIDKMIFPQQIKLNSRGYARVPVTLKPLEDKDYRTNGFIEIYALMDGAKYFDIGSGQITLTYDIPPKIKKYLIDSNTGDVKSK